MKSMLASLFRRRDRAVLAAYGRIVERAREPVFYTGWGVPDTLDGRFELLALHAFLVLNRLKRAPEAQAFAQELFDLMFDDLDRSLREMGAADLGVGRRIKQMASGFLGRIAAYDKGLSDAETLMDALRRNLYGTAAPSSAQIEGAARYVSAQAAALGAQPTAELLRGEVGFAAMEAG